MFVTTVNFQWPTEMTPIYSTHRGDLTTTVRGTVKRYDGEYPCYDHGFQHWVTDANADFHNQGLSHGDKTINHGWNGFKPQAPETTVE